MRIRLIPGNLLDSPIPAAQQKSWMCTFPRNAEWELWEGSQKLPNAWKTLQGLGTSWFSAGDFGNRLKGWNSVSMGRLLMDDGKVLLHPFLEKLGFPSSEILGNSGKCSSWRNSNPAFPDNPVLPLRNSLLAFPNFGWNYSKSLNFFHGFCFSRGGIRRRRSGSGG